MILPVFLAIILVGESLALLWHGRLYLGALVPLVETGHRDVAGPRLEGAGPSGLVILAASPASCVFTIPGPHLGELAIDRANVKIVRARENR